MEIGERYLRGLAGLDLQLPAGGGCWHLFVIQCEGRDALAAHLAEAGVQTAIHYPVPPHLSGAYVGGEFPSMPITEKLAATALSLPMSAFHTDGEIDHVITAMHEFFGE